MAIITFIVGLAGSGKTHLAEKRHAETGTKVFQGIHDTLPKKRVIEFISTGKDCLVEEEIYLCDPQFRDVITKEIEQELPGTKIKWICFENDLETANWNVVHRKDKANPDMEGHVRINSLVSPSYTYPENCEMHKIYKISA